MAIGTPTQVFANGNTANLSAYDTQVVTLLAGRKYYLQVGGYRTAANNISSVVHDPAGTPLSFTLVTDGTTSARRTAWDTAGHRTEEIWEVVPSADTASALIRITWAAGQSSCGWRLVEVPSGFDTSGTTVQVVTAQGTTTAVALTMAAFGATDNLLLLFVGWGTGTGNPTATIAPTEGRTELGENNDGERLSLGAHYQNPNGGDTSVGATLSATNDWGGIGIEVKALAASGNLGTSSATVAFTTAAVLTTAISLVASATVAFTTAAVLTTAISLAASSTVAFSTAASLTTAISLAAAATIAFTTAADLTTAISLVATATVAFSSVADLTATGPTGDLGTATATVAFTTSAVLTTAISLAAAATVAFTTAAVLTTAISLAASSTVAFSTAAVLTTAIQLAAAATIVFSSAATLTAPSGGPTVVEGRHFNPVRARSTQELLTYFERLQNGTLQFRRLDVVGPVRTAVRTITASETMRETDRTILADATGGAVTVTLPDLADLVGVELVVKRVNAGANAVTVQGQSGQLIDGGTVTLAAQWDLVRVQAGVDGWFRV